MTSLLKKARDTIDKAIDRAATKDVIPMTELVEEIEAALADTSDQDELEFLRFYFKRSYRALGPADADILAVIVAEFKAETGKKVSSDYDWSEEA